MKTIIGKLEHETAKALLIKTNILVGGGIERTEKVWLPKSQTEVINENTYGIPAWLLDAKLSEIQVGYSANICFI